MQSQDQWKDTWQILRCMRPADWFNPKLTERDTYEHRRKGHWLRVCSSDTRNIINIKNALNSAQNSFCFSFVYITSDKGTSYHADTDKEASSACDRPEAELKSGIAFSIVNTILMKDITSDRQNTPVLRTLVPGTKTPRVLRILARGTKTLRVLRELVSGTKICLDQKPVSTGCSHSWCLDSSIVIN